MSKTQKVLEALQSGEQLTAKQIASRFKLVKPHNAIYDLRQSGYAIYLNEHKNSKGQVTTKYRLGNPSRKLIAAGYKAIAMGLA